MIPSNVRIFVCTQTVDMRRSFDGLAQAARELLGEEPENGGLFVFSGKNGKRLKILWLDGNGYCLLYKRLHGARFVLPRKDGGVSVKIDAEQLGVLLQGVKRDGKTNLH